ncbi:MAG: Fic family protein [Sphingobacteriia bacterium]|nr:Fic family protein [Sphingobacteriia bacterium]
MFDINKIIITSEMLSLIAEIDEFKGAWQLLGKLHPEKLYELRKVATIESIGSSTRIEGVKLSNQEVEQLLSNLNQASFISRDEQEVAGYALTCDEIYQSYEYMTLSENLIKQLNNWLLKYSDKDQTHKGEYKKIYNNVEAFDENGKSLGIIFKTSPPFETPIRMQELVFWTQEQLTNKTLHPLLLIGIFVVTFLAIHPFQDGNGRLSRVLTTLLLLRSNYSYVPYSSLESIIERNKESYYLALRKTQSTLKNDAPDFTPWLLFFLRSLQKQKIHLEQKVLRLKALELYMPELSKQIITLLSEHSKLSISEITVFTNANYNTIKKHLSKLVNEGQIIKHGKSKATWYTLFN